MLLFQKYPAPFCLQKEMKSCTWPEKVPNQWILYLAQKMKCKTPNFCYKMKAVGAFRNIEIVFMCNHVYIYQVCNEIQICIPIMLVELEGRMWKLNCTESVWRGRENWLFIYTGLLAQAERWIGTAGEKVKGANPSLHKICAIHVVKGVFSAAPKVKVCQTGRY